ncbi:MAG: cytochrome C oxidase subunit IV family protein [Firmicutes bacterium]|nr:cytochrome C oxidase subunit IV family protein [Alicyclobacillaceae bacterium]MCL6497705.1 cytochrome C oxidase subunit IV family protein [Bacillota bacterium]
MSVHRAPDAEEHLPYLEAHFESETRFPWIKVVGYAGSLVLTLVAFWAVSAHWMSPTALLAFILGLAVAQAALQLGVFMHLRESRGPSWQIAGLGLGLFIAVGLVGMSIWIMLFKSGVS